MHVNSAVRKFKAIGGRSRTFDYGSVDLPNAITTPHAETEGLMDVMRIIVSHVQIITYKRLSCRVSACIAHVYKRHPLADGLQIA
jgi:hypothetical protein